jgi:PIN domain nuclease of toxin-antitoxin system
MLDTHALIWALEGSSRLSKLARREIANAANEILVSAVCGWEITIKQAMGKLEVPDDLLEAIDAAGFVRCSIGFAETRRLATLPHHHNDPFDRMLIAHALEEGCALITRDAQIARYPIQTIW